MQRCNQSKKDLDAARQQGFRVIDADESIFVRETIKAKAFSNVNLHLELKSAMLGTNPTHLVAAISADNGVEAFLIQGKSFNS